MTLTRLTEHIRRTPPYLRFRLQTSFVGRRLVLNGSLEGARLDMYAPPATDNWEALRPLQEWSVS